MSFSFHSSMKRHANARNKHYGVFDHENDKKRAPPPRVPALRPTGATREDPSMGSSATLSGMSSTWDSLKPFSFCRLSRPCLSRVLAAKHRM